MLFCNPSPEFSPKQKGMCSVCTCKVCESKVFYLSVCVVTVQQRSDLGAIGARRGRKQVRGTVETQRGGGLRVGGQGERDRRVLVVGMEAKPLPSVAHVVCESRTEGVRRTAGAVVEVRARVQLIQGDGGDRSAIHSESVAGVAGKVRERVRSHHGAHVHLRIILLTAVILQRWTGGEVIVHHCDTTPNKKHLKQNCVYT